MVETTTGGDAPVPEVVRQAAIAEAPAGAGSDAFLDLYKLAVEMADRTAARRATANAFFLTLDSALLAATGLVRSTGPSAAQVSAPGDRFGLLLLAAAGLLLSLTWWALLHSYRALNSAKFTVINGMEQRLPAAIFTDEWTVLRPPAPREGQEPARWWTRYIELGMVERVVPLVYAALYIAVGIRALML